MINVLLTDRISPVPEKAMSLPLLLPFRMPSTFQKDSDFSQMLPDLLLYHYISGDKQQPCCKLKYLNPGHSPPAVRDPTESDS